MKKPIFTFILLQIFIFLIAGKSFSQMPLIGDNAPSFTANSTMGEITFPDDYLGKWKILFSHPGDFTPVCTSEMLSFAMMSEEFKELNCQLFGLSVDGKLAP